MARRIPLVCQHLEQVSGEILVEYQDIIRQYIRRRNGIYALYRRGKLYYVGLARNLRGRLKQHLRDRHGGKWDRFSVYLTIGDSHMKELESMLLRIVRPTGNKQSGKFYRSENLRTRLSRDIRGHHKEQLDALMGRKSSRKPDMPIRESGDGKGAVLAEYFSSPVKLRGRCKGEVFKARVRRDGMIRFNKKLYYSPSMAAVAALRRPSNGWWFWHFERAPGDWVQLRELRR